MSFTNIAAAITISKANLRHCSICFPETRSLELYQLSICLVDGLTLADVQSSIVINSVMDLFKMAWSDLTCENGGDPRVRAGLVGHLRRHHPSHWQAQACCFTEWGSFSFGSVRSWLQLFCSSWIFTQPTPVVTVSQQSPHRIYNIAAITIHPNAMVT